MQGEAKKRRTEAVEREDADQWSSVDQGMDSQAALIGCREIWLRDLLERIINLPGNHCVRRRHELIQEEPVRSAAAAVASAAGLQQQQQREADNDRTMVAVVAAAAGKRVSSQEQGMCAGEIDC